MADKPKYPSIVTKDRLTVVLDGVAHDFDKSHPFYKEAMEAHAREDKETLRLASELPKLHDTLRWGKMKKIRE